VDPGPAAVLDQAEDLSRRPKADPPVLRRGERWLILALAALTFAVHNVSYLLSQPFWLDEAWVAVTTRFPLSKLPAVTSSTPIGWSLLLRVFVVGGEQRLRLLPLAFAALTVAAAYLFGRGLGWRDARIGIGAGVLAGIAALTSPAMLQRNDLKQYTADAFLALTVLAVLSRLEREWTRRRLAILAAVVVGGMLLSSTTAFVGAAAFGGVVVVLAVRRAWPRLVEAVVAGGVAGAGMLAVYVGFDARAVVPGLTSYWSAYYIPLHNGPGAALRYIRTHIALLHSVIGLGPTWLIALLALCGLVTLARSARPMVALAIALLGPEMVVLSGLQKYPLLDQRTSTFLIVVVEVLAAIGVAGLCALAARWNIWPAAAVATVAAVVFVAGASGSFRIHSIPNEDVRSQAAYVYAHRSADDVVLVNVVSSWGFAYYWPEGTPSSRPNSNVLQSYLPYFPKQPQIIVASNSDATAVDAALTQAVTSARAHPGARIWLVRTHVNGIESAAWTAALQADGLTAQQVDTAGLSVITLN
jgi:hypothetical protein